MKHPTIKYRRWQLPWLSRLILVPATMLFFVLSAQAQSTVILPPIGGGGGGQFVARCPESQYLTGFELRTGDDVDAIRPLCVKAYGPRDTDAPILTTGTGLRGTGVFIPTLPSGRIEIQELESGWYGGTGGGLRNLLCPKDTPIVIGLYVGAEGVDTVIVNNLHLFCGIAATTQQPSEFPSAVFDGPNAQATYDLFGGNPLKGGNAMQRCPAGLVAVGINGRSGKWLDAVGLICGEPKLQEVVKLTRRVKGAPGTGAPLISICEAAREARARNSPAAPGLEAQCRAAGAAGETPPVKLVGRAKAGTPTDTASHSICDLAREARARNSPATPGLEAQCRANLAAKGAAIAQADETVAQARAAEADEQYRQGFDIATGIFGDPALGAQGNTAVGPGSLSIRNSLSDAGQRGFDASVKLHLSRNYKP